MHTSPDQVPATTQFMRRSYRACFGIRGFCNSLYQGAFRQSCGEQAKAMFAGKTMTIFRLDDIAPRGSYAIM